jgi:hypothetical protein
MATKKTSAQLKAEGKSMKQKGQAMKKTGQVMKVVGKYDPVNVAGRAVNNLNKGIATGANIASKAGSLGMKAAQQGAGKVVKGAMAATNVLGAALNPIGTAVKIMNASQKAQAKAKASSNKKSYADSKGGKTTVSKNANGSKTVVYKKGDVKTTKTSTTKPGKSTYKTGSGTSTKFTPNVTKSTIKVEAPKGTTIKNTDGSKKATTPKPAPVKVKPITGTQKVAPKKSSSTSSKSEEVTPLAPRKATEISIARPEIAKTPVKQKFGARVKAKVAEAVTNRREKKLAKLKSKLGKMKTGGMVNPNVNVSVKPKA